MIRIKYHPPGTPPATLATPDGEECAASGNPPIITLVQYDEENLFESQLDSLDELDSRFDPQKVNWINIDGLGDVGMLHQLAKRFNLHPLALEDVMNTSQRPKVEHFGDHFFIVSEMVYVEDDRRVTLEQLSIFLGENFVITVQEEPEHDIFENVRRRLRSGRGFARKMKSDYLVYALLDATVDQFFPILEGVGDSIETVEEELLAKPSREILHKLHDGKRLLLQLRRAAWPQREIFSTLIRDDSGLIQKETQIFLRDCYDHTTQVIDLLESFRDLAAGLMDVYISSLGFRTNEIMRVLTVVTVLFIPLTFLAGIYGMNFNTEVSHWNMPELEWHYGYLYFWGVCIVTVVGMLIFFKRKNWL